MRHLLRLHAYPSHRSLPFIQPHFVSNHRDEFAVGGFAPQVVNGIAEVAIEGIHIAPVPRHLDGVADGPLHAAGSGAVFLGNFRVEALGHSVDVLRLVHGEQDGIPQELVTFDVGGNTDLVQDLSDCQFIAVHAGVQDALFLPGSYLQHAVCQNRLVKGLDEVVSKALVQQLLHHFLALERPVTKKEV